MKKQLTLSEVITLLAARCKEHGSQRAFAEMHDVSAQYVTDVLRKHREPGEKILDALGLQKVIVYTEKEKK